MSKHRRGDWTPYGMPGILAHMRRRDDAVARRYPAAGTENEAPVVAEESPTLYWVQKSAIEVAIGLAAKGVPSHTAAELLRSSNIDSHGLMCFEKPIGTLRWGVDPGIDVSWDAVMWSLPSDWPTGRFGERPMLISFMSRMTDHQHLLLPESRGVPLSNVYVLPLDSDEVLLEEGADDEISTDIGLLTSILLTAGQPRITSQKALGPGEGVVVPRQHRGNVSRPAPEVVLIDLLPRPDGASNARAQGPAREYDHRWWVRGYYKMQHYGPKGSLRKSIYISPHTAGPEDKPLSQRPRVNVIRGQSSARSTEPKNPSGPGGP